MPHDERKRFRRVRVRVVGGERERYAWVAIERAKIGLTCKLVTGDGVQLEYEIVALDTLVAPGGVIAYCQDIEP